MALRASTSVSVGRGQISTSSQLVARNASISTSRRHTTRAFKSYGASTRSLHVSVRSRHVSSSRVYATAALTQALGTAMKSASKAIKGPIFIAGTYLRLMRAIASPSFVSGPAAAALWAAKQLPSPACASWPMICLHSNQLHCSSRCMQHLQTLSSAAEGFEQLHCVCTALLCGMCDTRPSPCPYLGPKSCIMQLKCVTTNTHGHPEQISEQPENAWSHAFL